jgi:hypothetical protein
MLSHTKSAIERYFPRREDSTKLTIETATIGVKKTTPRYKYRELAAWSMPYWTRLNPFRVKKKTPPKAKATGTSKFLRGTDDLTKASPVRMMRAVATPGRCPRPSRDALTPLHT